MKRIIAAQLIQTANELIKEKQFDLSNALMKIADEIVPPVGFGDQDLKDLPGEVNDDTTNYTGQLDFYRKEIRKYVAQAQSDLPSVEGFVNESNKDVMSFFKSIDNLEKLISTLHDFSDEYVDVAGEQV